LNFCVLGKFPETALRAMHSRQATHSDSTNFSGFVWSVWR